MNDSLLPDNVTAAGLILSFYAHSGPEYEYHCEKLKQMFESSDYVWYDSYSISYDSVVVQWFLNAEDLNTPARESWVELYKKIVSNNSYKDYLNTSSSLEGFWGYTLAFVAEWSLDLNDESNLRGLENTIKKVMEEGNEREKEEIAALAFDKIELKNQGGDGWLCLLRNPNLDRLDPQHGPKVMVYAALSSHEGQDELVRYFFLGPYSILMKHDLMVHKGYHQWFVVNQKREIFKEKRTKLVDGCDYLLKSNGYSKDVQSKIEDISKEAHFFLYSLFDTYRVSISLQKQIVNYKQLEGKFKYELKKISHHHNNSLELMHSDIDFLIQEFEKEVDNVRKTVELVGNRVDRQSGEAERNKDKLMVAVAAALSVPQLIDQGAALSLIQLILAPFYWIGIRIPSSASDQVKNWVGSFHNVFPALVTKDSEPGERLVGLVVQITLIFIVAWFFQKMIMKEGTENE